MKDLTPSPWVVLMQVLALVLHSGLLALLLVV